MPIPNEIKRALRYGLLYLFFGLDVLMFYLGIMLSNSNYNGGWDLVTPILVGLFSLIAVFFNVKKIYGRPTQLAVLTIINACVFFAVGFTWALLN